MNDLTLRFVEEHLQDDVRALALKKAPIGVDMPWALRQIEARQILHKKVPSWSKCPDLQFPAHLSVEQCSSEATARYKAALFAGTNFADLTGGLGVDCHALSQGFSHGDYVERDADLCALARHNFAVLNDDIDVWNETAEQYLSHGEPVDLIYLDPARRDAYGRKTVSISDCTPDVAQLQDRLMEQARKVAVKLSPMLDITKALGELKCVSEVHVLAVANECKELLFIMEPGHGGATRFVCANLSTSQPVVEFIMDEERTCPLCLADGVGRYLYEPNVALMKGGCFKLLSRRFDVSKLHKNSHLFTSDDLVPDFPGRIFEVEAWEPYGKKLRNSLLSDVSKASLTVRNFPMTVAALRKVMKLADGDEVFLFATTLKGEERVVIKTKRVVMRRSR